MSLLKHIIAIMCTFLVATECQASEPQMPDLSIRSIIQSVTPAIETSNALLELRFLNRSTRPVSIPFVALSAINQGKVSHQSRANLVFPVDIVMSSSLRKPHVP
jgi:hypothetical protein